MIDSIIATSGDGGTVDKYKVKVRVQFDDGSTTEFSSKLYRHNVGYHYEGAIVPIRYDAEDRSTIRALRRLTDIGHLAADARGRL